MAGYAHCQERLLISLWWVDDIVFHHSNGQTISIMILTTTERRHNERVLMSVKRMKQIRVLRFCHEMKIHIAQQISWVSNGKLCNLYWESVKLKTSWNHEILNWCLRIAYASTKWLSVLNFYGVKTKCIQYMYTIYNYSVSNIPDHVQ